MGDAPAEAGAASPYDVVPYSVCAFPQTRPDRLAAIAMLLGLSPAPPHRCRVLELGCASGGNLIPLALVNPKSHFLGIDLSARQIDDGRRVARELALGNVDLRAMNIADLNADLGPFDYILAHGVYSWVSPQVQAKILDICSRQLSPQGVAYISYNVYPGWHARAAVREMLLHHTRDLQDPAARVKAAREFIAFLAASTPGGESSDPGFGALIRKELGVVQRISDTYLLHEHLEEYNEPLYFHQFVRRAAQKGLQYLAEAHVGSMIPERHGAAVEARLRKIAPDLLQMEQYMDFVKNRMFRQTLLCRAEVPRAHAFQPQVIRSLYVSSLAKPASEQVSFEPGRAEEFRAPGNCSLHSGDPLMKAVMLCLKDNQSVPVPYASLLSAARGRLAAAGVGIDEGAAEEKLPARLLNAFTAGVIDLAASPPCYTAKISERPVASPYARLRAREGGSVVNFRLETIPLSEPSRLVLGYLDGENDLQSLAAMLAPLMKKEMAAHPQAPGSPPAEARSAEFVRLLMGAFARNAMLCA